MHEDWKERKRLPSPLDALFVVFSNGKKKKTTVKAIFCVPGKAKKGKNFRPEIHANDLFFEKTEKTRIFFEKPLAI